MHATFYRGEQGIFPMQFLQVLFESRDEQNPFQDTDPEEGNETDAGRNTEVRSGYQESQNSTNHGKGNIQKYQSCILQVAEHDEQEQKNKQQTDRHHFQ